MLLETDRYNRRGKTTDSSWSRGAVRPAPSFPRQRRRRTTVDHKTLRALCDRGTAWRSECDFNPQRRTISDRDYIRISQLDDEQSCEHEARQYDIETWLRFSYSTYARVRIYYGFAFSTGSCCRSHDDTCNFVTFSWFSRYVARTNVVRRTAWKTSRNADAPHWYCITSREWPEPRAARALSYSSGNLHKTSGKNRYDIGRTRVVSVLNTFPE